MTDSKEKNGVNVEQVPTYDPKRDAPVEHELNKHFLNFIPSTTLSHIDRFITDRFTDIKERKIFFQLVASCPMILRVLVYIYSDPADIETRMKILAFYNQADAARNDLRNPQIQQDVYFCWNLSKNPNIAKYEKIRNLLDEIQDSFSKVVINDLRKEVGEYEISVQGLRDNWKRIYETENEKVTTMDNSPFNKIEYRYNKKKNIAELHRHILDGSNTDECFFIADTFMTEWLQWFSNWKGNESIIVFIHGPDGELVDPPGNHTNPFPLDLADKYSDLIQGAARKHAQMISSFDIEASTPDEYIFKDVNHLSQSESVITFIEKVIPEWKGNLPPSVHFSKTLPKRLLDKLKVRKPRESIRMEKTKTIENISFYDEDIDEVRQMIIPSMPHIKDDIDKGLSGAGFPCSVDLEEIPDNNTIPSDEYLAEQEQHDMLKQIVLEEEKKEKNQLKRLILRHISETFDGVQEMTAKQLTELHYTETNRKISTQAVTKARRDVEERLVLKMQKSLGI